MSTIHLTLGLTDDEYRQICDLLARQPNHLELAMYAVMWSEHCSYKSSRLHLSKLPSSAPWVLVGPGENAGVIDVGDGIAVALRIESHNHPCAIEPYQGAATGVGGILRDIFTMGARPIATLDALRFGSPDETFSRFVANGVVGGISGYGNSVGVPTVGGETIWCDTYDANPLVNVAALGTMPVERLVLGQASAPGELAVLMGAATGRDGIGGVSVLASAGFSDDAAAEAAKRPNVQVGDPYEEKRLIEACLELLDAGLVSGIQDLGGAGLTCAASETASRGGTGMTIDVAAVHCRERPMEPFEIMTSESQERMLAIVAPQHLAEVRRICERWEVAASVVGRVTDDGYLRVVDSRATSGPDHDERPNDELPAEPVELACVRASTLHDDAPLYDRPAVEPADLAARHAVDVLAAVAARREGAAAEPPTFNDDLLALIGSPAPIYRQYDHQLFASTVVGPGADAALLALRHPSTGALTGKALAVSVDGNHRWCAADPSIGAAATVAESVMNVACVGATPKALVNCLNFGNPEHPEVMWQLRSAIEGMAWAAERLGVPVVGGNVSLYNEAGGVDIAPTPVVCTLGVRERLDAPPPAMGVRAGQSLVLLGEPPSQPPASPLFGGSAWAWHHGVRAGAPAPVDIDAVARVASLVASLVANGDVDAVHDVSDGGLAVCLAEMACASSPNGSPSSSATNGSTGALVGIDAHLGAPFGTQPEAALFGETHGRAVVAVDPARLDELTSAAAAAGVAPTLLGTAGGDRFRITLAGADTLDDADAPAIDLPLATLRDAWRGAVPRRLGMSAGQM